MSEMVDRIAEIIKWHVLHAGEAEVADCLSAAEEITQLIADPTKPTQPEIFASERARQVSEELRLSGVFET